MLFPSAIVIGLVSSQSCEPGSICDIDDAIKGSAMLQVTRNIETIAALDDSDALSDREPGGASTPGLSDRMPGMPDFGPGAGPNGTLSIRMPDSGSGDGSGSNDTLNDRESLLVQMATSTPDGFREDGDGVCELKDCEGTVKDCIPQHEMMEFLVSEEEIAKLCRETSECTGYSCAAEMGCFLWMQGPLVAPPGQEAMGFTCMIKCFDDPNWTDHVHGQGGGTCAHMKSNPDWCTDYGDYSVEASRACPVSCGVCGKKTPTPSPTTTPSLTPSSTPVPTPVPSVTYTKLDEIPGFCVPQTKLGKGYRCLINEHCESGNCCPIYKRCQVQGSVGQPVDDVTKRMQAAGETCKRNSLASKNQKKLMNQGKWEEMTEYNYKCNIRSLEVDVFTGERADPAKYDPTNAECECQEEFKTRFRAGTWVEQCPKAEQSATSS